MDDTPATVTQIINAGFDPTATGVTYTVDSSGTVSENFTGSPASSASAGGTTTQPLWPLLIVLGVIGYTVFTAGKRSRR